MKSLIVFLALLTSSVSANECANDINKFCRGVEPARGQLAKCLSDYADQINPGCAKELKIARKETLNKNPCYDDLIEFCGDVPGQGHVLEYCLIKNEKKLSERCSKDFKQKKSGILQKNVCAQDIVNNCYTKVSGTEGNLNHCMIRNRGKLSGACKKKTEDMVLKMKMGNPCFADTEKHCADKVRFIDIQRCLEKKATALAPGCKVLVQKEVDKSKANPCYTDLITHCKPGLTSKDQDSCLSLNENHLSNSCRQFRTVRNKKINKMVKSCEADRLKFCAKEPFQDGKVVKCLRGKKTQLTKACAALL